MYYYFYLSVALLLDQYMESIVQSNNNNCDKIIQGLTIKFTNSPQFSAEGSTIQGAL